MSENSGNAIRVLVLLLALALLSGCGLSKMQKRQVVKFADTTVSLNESLAQQVEYARDQGRDYALYTLYEQAKPICKGGLPKGCKEYSLKQVQGKLTHEQLVLRLRVLDALALYGKTLALLVKSDQADAIEEAAQELAEALSDVADERDDFTLSSSAEKTLGDVVEVLGRWVVERKRAAAARQIVDVMQPSLETLTSALQRDFLLQRNSLCREAVDESLLASKPTGLLDVLCTLADKAQYYARRQLEKEKPSAFERERALRHYASAIALKQHLTKLSAQSTDAIQQLKASHKELGLLLQKKAKARALKPYINSTRRLKTLIDETLVEEGGV